MNRHELLFAIRRSTRYHTRRRQYFDRCAKLKTAFVSIGGIGTVSTLLAKTGSTSTLIYGCIAGVFSILDLVFRPSELARVHSDLSREFIQLEREIISGGEGLSETHLAVLFCKRLEIEEKEPPKLEILDIMCHNDICRSMGYEKCEEWEITRLQKYFAQLVDIHSPKMKKNSAT